LKDTFLHSFASHLVEQGTDLFTVKELLGHPDYAMASRYSHVGAETLRKAVRKLDMPPQEQKVEVVPIAE
jgi:site-specific recombinase XerD